MRIFVLALSLLCLLVACAASVAHAAPDGGPAVVVAPLAPVASAPAIGTSPSVPALGDAWSAFGSGHYALGVASLLLGALVLLRRMAPGLFSSDLAGAATALAGAFLGALVTALGTGAPLGWGMIRAAFTVAVLAMGGYSVLWRKLLKPALRALAAALELDALGRALK